MKRLVLKKSVLAILLTCNLSAFAQDFQVGDLSYRIVSGEKKTVTVSSCHNELDPIIDGGEEDDDVIFDAKPRHKAAPAGTYEETIPQTVTHSGTEYTVVGIDANAFQGREHLSIVSLPATLTFIGSEAFSGCKALQSITCYVKTPISISSNVFDSVNRTSCTLTVYRSSLPAYKSASVWREFLLSSMDDPYIVGDVNQDGKISVADIVGIVTIINGRDASKLNIDAANVNGDAVIDIKDIDALRKLISE